MFEKFFGPRSEEQKEKNLLNVVGYAFEAGVNSPAIYNAFNAIRAENKKKGYGFTNNLLLNMVRDCAVANISDVEILLMGGRDQVISNINSEIESLRRALPEGERGE